MSFENFRYWLEDIELRKKLEENQLIVVVALILLILTSLTLVMCQFTGGGASGSTSKVELIYFDLGSQSIRLVEHRYPAQPKSPLEGTEDVFLATVFKCEECPDGSVKDGMSLADLKAEGMFIGWLEKIDENVSDEMVMFGEGYAYRTIETDRWYKPTDRGYEALNRRVYEKCENARICRP